MSSINWLDRKKPFYIVYFIFFTDNNLHDKIIYYIFFFLNEVHYTTPDIFFLVPEEFERFS